MPCEFRFLITAPHPALLPQVARALQAYTDQDFRARYPRLWAVYDRLMRYSKEKSPREDRKILRFFRVAGGLVNWLLGLFLLLPTTLALGEFFFLFLVGAIAFLAGNMALWKSARRLLGILSLAACALCLFGAVSSPEQLGRLGVLSVVELIVGLRALLFRRQKEDRFERSARLLLEQLSKNPEQSAEVRVDGEGLWLPPQAEGEEPRQLPFGQIRCLVRAPELYMIVWRDQVMLLPKKSLVQGDPAQLEELLVAQPGCLKI